MLTGWPAALALVGIFFVGTFVSFMVTVWIMDRFYND